MQELIAKTIIATLENRADCDLRFFWTWVPAGLESEWVSALRVLPIDQPKSLERDVWVWGGFMVGAYYQENDDPEERLRVDLEHICEKLEFPSPENWESLGLLAEFTSEVTSKEGDDCYE